MKKIKKIYKKIVKFFDSKPVEVDLPFDRFTLICCDCKLAHEVFISQISKNKILVGLDRDDTATDAIRKTKKLKKKIKKLKRKFKDEN